MADKQKLLIQILETDAVETWEFGQQIRKIVLVDNKSEGSVSELGAALEAIVSDLEQKHEVRFKALIGCIHLNRRHGNLGQTEKLLLQNESDFGSEDLFEYYLNDYRLERTDTRVETALTAALRIFEKGKNPAFGNAYCKLVVEVLSRNMPVYEIESHTKRARSVINDIIALQKNYADFFYTKGSLLAALGEMAQAKQAVQIAIDKEDSDKSDYPIRLQRYSSKILEIDGLIATKSLEIKQENYFSRMEEKVQSVEKIAKDNVVRNIEILGFFIAAISFFAASVKISGSYEPAQAVVLIFMILGTIMLLFSTLGIIARGISAWRGSLFQFGIGVLVIVFALKGLPAFIADTPLASKHAPVITKTP